MAHHKKKHGPAPVPHENQPKAGPPTEAQMGHGRGPATGSPFQDQDAKRRIGDFEGAGEHSRQQPSPVNDGTTHSR
ncbi:MAG TPA: hypothetical protein VFA18_07005 [Gemmataceae bacterium]|nr:hypothetical protein [Gemmataceae bacterium]